MRSIMTGVAASLILAFAVLSMAIFPAVCANAGMNQWTACGQIYGGIIRDTVVSDGNIYVATRASGIHYSEDGGESWRQLAWPNGDVFSLAVDKNDPNVQNYKKICWF